MTVCLPVGLPDVPRVLPAQQLLVQLRGVGEGRVLPVVHRVELRLVRVVEGHTVHLEINGQTEVRVPRWKLTSLNRVQG